MICLICDIDSSGFFSIDPCREVHTCDDCPHFEKNRCPECFDLTGETYKPKRICRSCGFDEAEERHFNYLFENDEGFRKYQLEQLAKEELFDHMFFLYSFSPEKMEDHPLLDGVKHYHLNFENDKYFSVIGGHSEVIQVFGDGKKTFEVFTSENFLEKNSSENYVNLMLKSFMRKHGFPTKKKVKEPEY
jgi:hypothetical protein